jgi:hypothetical protein
MPKNKRAAVAVFCLVVAVPMAILMLATGGPKVFHFLSERAELVQGQASGCAPGEAFRYTYLVGQKSFENRLILTGSCKKPIAAGKEIQVYYLPSDPNISWSGSNPRDELIVLIVLILLAAQFSASWTYIWIGRKDGR